MDGWQKQERNPIQIPPQSSLSLLCWHDRLSSRLEFFFSSKREQKRDISMTLYVLHSASVGRRGENFDDGKKKQFVRTQTETRQKVCCCYGWEDDGMEQRRNKNTRWSAKKIEESEKSVNAHKSELNAPFVDANCEFTFECNQRCVRRWRWNETRQTREF